MILAAQIIQGTVIAFLLSWIGLSLGSKLGLDAPILRSWVTKSKKASFTGTNIIKAIGLGALATLLVVGIELFWFQKVIPQLKGGKIDRSG